MRTKRLAAAAVLVGLSLMLCGCPTSKSGNSFSTGPAPAPAPNPNPNPTPVFTANPQPDNGAVDPNKSFTLFASAVPGSTSGTFTMRCDFAQGSLKPAASRTFTVIFRVNTVASGDVELKSQLFNGGLPVNFPDKPLGSPPNIRVRIEENGTVIVPETSMLPSSASPTLGYKLGLN